MGDTGIIDITFILESEDVLEGEVPISLKHVRSFFGL